MFTYQVNYFTHKVIYITYQVNIFTSNCVYLFCKRLNIKPKLDYENKRSLLKRRIAPGTSNSKRAILIIRIVETILESITKVQNYRVSTITLGFPITGKPLEMAIGQ